MENKVHPCDRCCWYNPVTCNCEIPGVENDKFKLIEYGKV